MIEEHSVLICAFCVLLSTNCSGRPVTSVLGLFLGHIHALLGGAVPFSVGTVVITIRSVNPHFDIGVAAILLRGRGKI